ncbi:hypothetical protein MVEN_02492700 [Mycena venus]|uniref:Rho1 guanine nucleotide exchange factor 1 n=1 Tax=Mycena venus TaxID=2733690 RepID=A0A8H6WXQ6_9AGAR|nr:hypothetical protein MVEN_02492700 [Mycena venus]
MPIRLCVSLVCMRNPHVPADDLTSHLFLEFGFSQRIVGINRRVSISPFFFFFLVFNFCDLVPAARKARNNKSRRMTHSKSDPKRDSTLFSPTLWHAAMNHPNRPHVNIPTLPSGARAPQSPHLSSPAYDIQVTPPPYDNAWDLEDSEPQSSGTPRARAQSLFQSPENPLSRTTSASVTGYMPFPEPQIYRSASATASQTHLGHRYSRSDLGPAALRLQRDPSVTSFTTDVSGAYYPNDDNEFYASGSADSHGDSNDSGDDLSRDLSQLSLPSDGLRLFQTGELSDRDEEWYKLVPSETRDALGKREVQRQSVIFEVFKAEREYVFDLEAVREVYIGALRSASPPIIRETFLNKFINEVFGNLDQVVAHHQRMLGALFARQREQHPLVQSISDIILDTALKEDFRSSYEVYIKNYPLAESRHRKELSQNQEYQAFVQSVSTDPRIRKRDLTTFLSRPVTRLPRLNLLLEQILKLTDDGHVDKDTLPIILDVLTSCIKVIKTPVLGDCWSDGLSEYAARDRSGREQSQVLGARSESRLPERRIDRKCFLSELFPGLTCSKDMDLYADTRNLVRLAPVSRWNRTDTGLSQWVDLTAALLDNYFILTREEARPNGAVKRYLVSRPIPLSFMRLGTFNSPAENRRDGLKFHPLYPFTIHHAASKTRRYTLYVGTEAERRKWLSVFQEAIGLHLARQEANMYFEPHVLTDNFFRLPTVKIKGSKPTGRISTAVPFSAGGRKFLAVGCFSGIYAGHWQEEHFHKALPASNPTNIFAIETVAHRPFHRFVVQHDGSLVSYSLDLLGRVGLGQADPKSFVASLEKHDTSNVLFSNVVQIGKRVLVVYASKRLFQTTLDLHVLEAADANSSVLSPKRSNGGGSARFFRQFGDPGFIAKDAHSITALVKTIAISTQDRIVILDPTNLTRSAITFVPDFTDTTSTAASAAMTALKKRLEGMKPLGLLRCSATELLVVYDSMGCYVSRHGVPSRSSGYIRWECKAMSFAARGAHVLLFSPNFIEIRNVLTGLLVQVIDGQDIRLLHAADNGILAVMRGEHDDEAGVSEKVVELQETAEIVGPRTATVQEVPAMWEEWDM